MTRDDIIRMAKEVGGYITKQYPDELRIDTDDLVRFAALVAAAEREACLTILQDLRLSRIGVSDAIQTRGLHE